MFDELEEFWNEHWKTKMFSFNVGTKSTRKSSVSFEQLHRRPVKGSMAEVVITSMCKFSYFRAGQHKSFSYLICLNKITQLYLQFRNHSMHEDCVSISNLVLSSRKLRKETEFLHTRTCVFDMRQFALHEFWS